MMAMFSKSQPLCKSTYSLQFTLTAISVISKYNNVYFGQIVHIYIYIYIYIHKIQYSTSILSQLIYKQSSHYINCISCYNRLQSLHE